jgi:hypothetical protein
VSGYEDLKPLAQLLLMAREEALWCEQQQAKSPKSVNAKFATVNARSRLQAIAMAGAALGVGEGWTDLVFVTRDTMDEMPLPHDYYKSPVGTVENQAFHAWMDRSVGVLAAKLRVMQVQSFMTPPSTHDAETGEKL